MLRVDLHLHSNYSHDHNTFDGAAALVRMRPDLAIAGEEVKTLEGEVIGLFIAGRVQPFLRPEQAMDLIHQMGGADLSAAPARPASLALSRERVVALWDRVDIIETYNPWCDAASNQAAARLAEDLGKVAATGSDAHSADELGRSWMEMEEYSGTADFLEKLRCARHVVTASSGAGRRA